MGWLDHKHHSPPFDGTFIEGLTDCNRVEGVTLFPFLFGGTFIEGSPTKLIIGTRFYFPSFLEGLSLRRELHGFCAVAFEFPFLFGRAFIEASPRHLPRNPKRLFPAACGTSNKIGCCDGLG